MHFASPVSSGESEPSSDNCSSIHCIICRSIGSLNEIQIDMCTDVPQSLPVLTNAQPIISGECQWQFRKEKWDCAGITTPIIEEPNLKCKHTIIGLPWLQVHRQWGAQAPPNLCTCTLHTLVEAPLSIC